jgi:hypothetical protein
VSLHKFHIEYENIIVKALQQHIVDKLATNVELYLIHLFRKIDTMKTGTLPPSNIRTVLETSDKIKLTGKTFILFVL